MVITHSPCIPSMYQCLMKDCGFVLICLCVRACVRAFPLACLCEQERERERENACAYLFVYYLGVWVCGQG